VHLNRLLGVLLAAVLVSTSCNDGAHPDSDGPTAATASETATAGCEPALDSRLTAWERAGFSGTIAISTRGRFDCRAAYGLADRATRTPNTIDTVFSIGSISKAVTAAAISALVDAGQLRLDTRAGDLVPGLEGPAARATIRQLLLHTSGLTGSHGNDHRPLSRRAAVAAISRLARAFPPGADYAYSNAGYTLLALIIDAVAPQGYRRYIVSRVLTMPSGDVAGGFWDGEPAAPGPRAVGYLDDGRTRQMGDFPGPHWALSGNGDLAMTMPELAIWTYALFTGRIVSPASTKALGRAGFDHGDGTSETPGWVAFDRSVYGQPVIAAAGGGGDIGHDAVVAWLPESGRVIAMASNTADVIASDLVRRIAPALIVGRPIPMPRLPTGDTDPAELAAATGAYELPTGGRYEVTRRGTDLAIAAHGPRAVATLFPPPPGVADADIKRHEAAASALLAGETRQGRLERHALESELSGPIDVNVLGTVFDDGELRTYVKATSDRSSTLAWYALDEVGGVAAAEIGTAPPTLTVVPTGHQVYRPDDPTGAGAGVVVRFDNGRMTVTGQGDPIPARRVA
jgi:CubicO group peptidase (beta-lactamase class C family)